MLIGGRHTCPGAQAANKEAVLEEFQAGPLQGGPRGEERRRVLRKAGLGLGWDLPGWGRAGRVQTGPGTEAHHPLRVSFWVWGLPASCGAELRNTRH